MVRILTKAELYHVKEFDVEDFIESKGKVNVTNLLKMVSLEDSSTEFVFTESEVTGLTDNYLLDLNAKYRLYNIHDYAVYVCPDDDTAILWIEELYDVVPTPFEKAIRVQQLIVDELLTILEASKNSITRNVLTTIRQIEGGSND